MPALDIIGYLWLKRQAFGIESLPDVLMLVHDLVVTGLDCIQVEDMTVLGQTIGATTSYPRKTVEEWDRLVHAAILDASVAETVHMMSEWEEESDE